MTVVRHETRRRWLLVLAAVALLVALPAAVSAVPTGGPRVDAGVLRDRIRASVNVPHQGYAESVGALGLPALPRLDQVASLLSGTTRMRAWYAGRDRWRVDVVGTGVERGFYQTPQGEYSWDYGANRLTFVAAATTGYAIDPLNGAPEGVRFGRTISDAPARLPRAADLMPPDLAQRLLSTAAGDRVESIPAKRVAGTDAAGLRITSADPHTLIGHIDIWADPATGLALQVEVSAKGAERPVLVTRFLDVEMTAPAADVLAPPPRQDDTSFTGIDAEEAAAAIFEASAFADLPEMLAGRARRNLEAEWLPLDGQDRQVLVFRFSPITLYGTGLTQIAVLPLTRRVSGDAFRSVAAWGQTLTYPSGSAALISSSVVSVMVVRNAATRQTYLVAGMVDSALMQQVGAELVGVGE
jgi:hypothetical protein